MWRLTLILCACMFLALLIGGGDRGQLRPGLAAAEAERRANPNAVAPVVEAAPVLVTAEERAPVAAAAPLPLPAPAPAPNPQPVPTVTAAAPRPVFTLSAVTPEVEPVLNVVAEPEVGAVDPFAELPLEPTETPSADSGQILYVNAESVNVRQDPSTNAPVLGRLARGEPASVMWEEGADWLRIEAMNSDLEGYIARRLLSPQQP